MKKYTTEEAVYITSCIVRAAIREQKFIKLKSFEDIVEFVRCCIEDIRPYREKLVNVVISRVFETNNINLMSGSEKLKKLKIELFKSLMNEESWAEKDLEEKACKLLSKLYKEEK